ncbi:MtrAB system histidine kinase MtrB [Janibacter melonis]|uniref:MtrAB system histidine kinase MtrB n=1 Tax=Janibacter melonis TaxID=262209 RepID=UPI0020961BAA|nr:MtrAB system histidine kinase MtrB [Janibacter melonis]
MAGGLLPEPPSRPALPVRAVRRIVALWRRSLQLRVVTTTVVLGIITVSLISAAMYRSIAEGLIADRVSASQAQARQLAGDAQETLDQTDQTETPAKLSQAVNDIVNSTLAPPADDRSRYFVFARSQNNDEPGPALETRFIKGSGVDLDDIPPELRQAVAADPERQQTTTIDLRREGQSAGALTGLSSEETIPAVVVGSQITVPTAGAYDVYLVYPMEQEERTLATITRSFVLGALSLVLLVSAVAFVVTRQVVSPVRRAAAVSERLSSGHLNERMSARGHDDLAQLGRSFNDMADGLQAQIRQLEGLSRVQQRFVSDVSHELRTPLTTITMAADVLMSSKDELDPVAARSAELLVTELERFEALLADLLEISRHDAGAAVLELEPTDIYAVVDRAIASAEPIARVRGSEVGVVRTGSTAIAEVDSRRIERILRNLVVNAVEHGEGRPVTVHVGENDDSVSVVVEDHGVGLRAGEASLVFNRFWRADPARARTTGGTGLGLAISLEDARLHHGWLQAWGEPGQGSRFRLPLPKTPESRIQTAALPLTPTEMAADPSPRLARSEGGTP